MSFFALLALSFGMSMDAFAAALSRGSLLKQPDIYFAFRTALVFGVVEALTPLLGYALGVVAHEFITKWDHWLSFVMLGALGVYMIYGASTTEQQSVSTTTDKNSFFMTIVTAVATSIDAMVVGVTLAFLNVNIWLACFMIGTATTCIATFGVYFGHKLGRRFGKGAEIAGGVVLIAIGSFILLTHLWW